MDSQFNLNRKLTLQFAEHVTKALRCNGFVGGPKKLTAHYYYSGRPMKNLYLSFVTNFIILGSKGILHPTDTYELLRCDASRWISLRTLSLYKRNHIIIFFHYIWVFFHLFNRHPTIFCIINDKLLFSHY